MSSKQEKRAPAKKQLQKGATKAAKPTVVAIHTKTHTSVPSSAKSDFDDVADMFRAMKEVKAQQKSATGGNAASHTGSSSNTKKGHKPTASGKHGIPATSGVASSSSASANPECKPVRDGLYHAPQKSVQMNDNEFFSGTWLKADQAATSAGAVVTGGSADASEASQELLRKEGVDRIVSIEELSKMLSRNAKAGTTPNCPFDCDCCF